MRFQTMLSSTDHLNKSGIVIETEADRQLLMEIVRHFLGDLRLTDPRRKNTLWLYDFLQSNPVDLSRSLDDNQSRR